MKRIVFSEGPDGECWSSARFDCAQDLPNGRNRRGKKHGGKPAHGSIKGIRWKGQMIGGCDLKIDVMKALADCRSLRCCEHLRRGINATDFACCSDELCNRQCRFSGPGSYVEDLVAPENMCLFN